MQLSALHTQASLWPAFPQRSFLSSLAHDQRCNTTKRGSHHRYHRCHRNHTMIPCFMMLTLQAVVPAVLPALERNARSHWNPAVHGLTVNVRKMFQEMDSALYDQCRKRFENEEVRPFHPTPSSSGSRAGR